MIPRTGLLRPAHQLASAGSLAEAMGRFGLIRGFANPAKKPVDRFAEYIQSGEPDPTKGKDEIPDHTHAYGDDPVATISEVREEESAHKAKKSHKKSHKKD